MKREKGANVFGYVVYILHDMMTSSNGNIFRVTGPLWGESIGHRWILLKKASDAELWCFLWSTLIHKFEFYSYIKNNREPHPIQIITNLLHDIHMVYYVLIGLSYSAQVCRPHRL